MLCKGFSTTRIADDKILEVLYALLPDGTVLCTSEHRRTNEFAAKGRRWFVSDSIPSTAEFIGMERSALHRKLKSLSID